MDHKSSNNGDNTRIKGAYKMNDEYSKGDGRLWTNQYKKNEHHPDMRGYIEIGGLQYDFAAWKRSPENGKPKYLYVKIGDLKSNQRSKPLAKHEE